MQERGGGGGEGGEARKPRDTVSLACARHDLTSTVRYVWLHVFLPFFLSAHHAAAAAAVEEAAAAAARLHTVDSCMQ